MLSLSLLLNFALSATPQDPVKVEEFTRVVFEAEEVGDTKAMQAAMREFKEDAILAFIGRVERRLNEDSLELEKWVETFKELWVDTYSTNFAKNYDRYIQRLSSSQRNQRLEILQRSFPELSRLHLEALKDDGTGWALAVERANQLVQTFTDLGDLYYLSLTHNIVGNLYNPNYYKERAADSQKAFDAYSAALAARDKLGLRQDKFYQDTKLVLKELRDVLGDHEEDVAAEDAKDTRETIPVNDELNEASATVQHGIAKAKSKLVHASEAYDEDTYGWLRGTLPAVGQGIAIPNIEPVVNFVRIDTSSCRLEAGAKPSKEFKLSSSVQVINVMRLHDDGVERPYAIEFTVGSEESTYQGVKINLIPTDSGGAYFYRSPALATFDTDYGTVTVYDTNVDGKFGYSPMELAWCEGLLPNEWFWRPDSVTLDKQKIAQPFSRYIVSKKGEWYEVKLNSFLNPESLTLIPVSPVLGELQFRYKGVKKLKPLSVLIASESSATKGLVIDLMALPKKKLIPIGRYKFLQARFGGKDGEEALVIPDPNKVMLFDISGDGEAPELFIGGDFEIATAIKLDGTTLTVDGRSLHLVGDNSERWFRFVGAPLFDTEVAVSGAKPVTLALPTTDEVSELWDRFFYPMAASLELRKSATEVDVTLSFKKHPWFGNLKTTTTVKSE
jgi:hypothetical protein